MSPDKLSARIRLLQWLFPLVTVFLVILFQLVIAQVIYNELGNTAHFWAELLFYGTAGPLMAFFLLHFLSRWLEERETSELQARVLAEARHHAAISRGLNDDALQTLFAASILLSSLKNNGTELSPEMATTIQETEQAIDRAIKQIRFQLQKPAPSVTMIRQEG